MAELANGLCCALHNHDDDQGDHQHQQGLANQRVAQNLQSQGLAQLQRFGDLYDGHASACGAGNGLQQNRDTYWASAEFIVIEIDQRRVWWALGDLSVPKWKLFKTRDQLSVQRRDAIEHAALVVGLENLQRRVGHDGPQMRVLVKAGDANLLADAFGRCQQGSVVGRVQRCQGLLIQTPGIQCNQ